MRQIVIWIARLYLWATHRLYNEFAWAYDAASWLVSLGQWDRWRRQTLDYVIGSRILEVGFGTGELLIEMARRHLDVCGLDLSLAMHRVTAHKMQQRGIHAPRVRGDVQKTPCADGSFDTIIATFPAEYIASPATLREVARLLQNPGPNTTIPGGRFVVVGMIPDMQSPFLRRVSRFFFGASAKRAHARYEQTAAKAGLRITVVTPDGKGPRMPVVILEKYS